MTGAGTFALDSEHGHFDVDARSVNHRFLKTTVRLHGPLPALDRRVESRVKARAERGHITVHVRYQPAGTQLDERIGAGDFKAAAAYLSELAEATGLPPPRVADVLAAPGVLGEARAGFDEDTLVPLFDQAVEGALDQLLASRETEGAHMGAEVARLFGAIEGHAKAVETHAAEVPAMYRERLEKRLADLLEGRGETVDPAWLAREIALLADRADVREEIARIAAHVAHGRELLEAGGAVGRRLDFLVQELHREANTIGSKSGDLSLSRAAMDLKSDVERLREQVQNLE